MDTTTVIVLVLCGFVIGIILAWIIRKLAFEKNHVPILDYNSINNQSQEIKTQKAIIETELSGLKVESNRNASNLEIKMKEAERLSTDLSQRTAQKEALAIDIAELRNELLQLRESDDSKLKELQKTNTEVSRLNAEIKFKQEKLDTQKQEIENIGQKFEATFKVLTNSIPEDKAQKFTEQQETNLKTILEPLKQNIQNFKQEFESKYNKESEERISLREQIKHMIDLNQTLSVQVNNFTHALSNNVKQQGDWGEEILESILEFTGLQKNIQYFVQQRSYSNEGEIIQPDTIVKYPNGRAIVIDSKVSLIHHTRYCATDISDEQALHLNQLVYSLKLHIDGLSKKDYQDITDALDFIVMFVPNEAAYITAMQVEHELWQYAYKKRVLLISPTNLIPTMKLIADMWQKDAIGKNAQEIADKAGKLYDKLYGFVENFEKIGGQIEKAHNTWSEARKQLNKGRGNLLSQAEQIKKLQVKTNKQLPKILVDEAMLEDGIDLEDDSN